MRTLVTVLVVIMLAAVGLTLGAENGSYVRFNFLLAQGEYRLSSLMVFWFLSGFVLAWLMSAFWIVRLRMTRRSLRKQLVKEQHRRNDGEPAVSGRND